MRKRIRMQINRESRESKFLNAEKKKEFEMIAKTDPHIRKAYEQLLYMSEDGKKRLIYEARQKAIYDYNTQVYSNWHSGYEQGEKNGISIGEKNGISIGEEKKLIEQICKKMKKNLSAKEIANILEEDVKIVQRIYDTARPFAPDYDIEKIRKRLNKEKKQETN